jgi:acyl-CoA dehydrogenase family protein 9
MKRFLELSLEHTEARQQFGRPLADFEMVGDKLAWMTRQIYGIESMSYLTTGLVDRGDTDFALESAMTKVAASDTGWYALNRAVQLHGGEAYMADHPLSKALRDFRIFPIFEGANDVLRAFVALNGLKTLSEELPDVASLSIGDPGRALGVLAPYVAGRVQRRLRPERPVGVHPALAKQAAELGDQVSRLRERTEGALRKHGKKVQEKQLVQKRLADAASGIYAQTAVLSRASTALQEARADSEAERHLAVGFCQQSARGVGRLLRALEVNDDRHTADLARATRASGGYSFSL